LGELDEAFEIAACVATNTFGAGTLADKREKMHRVK
jgi:hypothetical protein